MYTDGGKSGGKPPLPLYIHGHWTALDPPLRVCPHFAPNQGLVLAPPRSVRDLSIRPISLHNRLADWLTTDPVSQAITETHS